MKPKLHNQQTTTTKQVPTYNIKTTFPRQNIQATTNQTLIIKRKPQIQHKTNKSNNNPTKPKIQIKEIHLTQQTPNHYNNQHKTTKHPNKYNPNTKSRKSNPKV